jgi:probable phosphoglycerate mutase
MGRADPPLSTEGREELARWRLPASFARAPVLASPLRRARETAASFGPFAVEPRLIEMDWGGWEGRRLDELRAVDPAGMAALEARGLELEPPGGESPRQVRERLATLLVELAGADRRVLVTHKGVIRATLALATGWDMRTKPPLRLRAGEALVLRLDAHGRPSPDVAAMSLLANDPRCAC